ncbi:hypothetical protein [Plantibacter sp. YIM 135347]|uniref:hypothetical protein n=1 Tax=Plantibacter sp. YIM 135347 TaxID=3423919 RepID=UPI003D34F802
MPLFSRRSPKPGQPAPPQAAAPGATGPAAEREPETQLIAPPPLFRNEDDSPDTGPSWSTAAPEGDGRPDDPDAPPRPGSVRQPDPAQARPADLDSLLASGLPWATSDPADSTGSAAATTSDPSAPASRPGSAVDDDRSRQPTGRTRSDAPSAVAGAARDPLRTRVLPAILLVFSIVIGLLSVLLVFLFEPGAVGWALVGAIVLIAIVQLCLLVGGIAVVRRRTARRLGIAAVVVTLLVNPLVATGVRGVVTAATGGPEAGSAAEHDWDPIWDAYPGSKYADAKDILGGPDYETFASESDALLLDLRETLTAEFGFEWVERQSAVTEPDHNGFGGDSMLFRYTAPVWQTTTTVTSLDDKNRVVELIRQVGLRHGIANLDFQNAPAAWREPGELTETYGGETLDTQARWTLHTYDEIGSQDSFSADVIDLSLDTTGSVTKDRQFDVDYYDMAPDGIEFHIDSSSLLKAADRKAFIDALAPYAGLDKPK